MAHHLFMRYTSRQTYHEASEMMRPCEERTRSTTFIQRSISYGADKRPGSIYHIYLETHLTSKENEVNSC